MEVTRQIGVVLVLVVSSMATIMTDGWFRPSCQEDEMREALKASLLMVLTRV